MKTVLFACVHNAGRSQMATALFNRYADPKLATAISAGTEPGDHIQPEVLAVMKEIDIDLSQAVPRYLSFELAAGASVLVTMGCDEACPVVPGAERLDWPLAEPKGKPAARVREIRDEVRSRVRALIAERAWSSDDGSAVVAELMPATREDERQVRALLEISALPWGGLETAFPEGYVVARAQDVVGCAGLEIYHEVGLLRSVAVLRTGRHRGLGSRLLEERVEAARRMNLREVYLLTTTAAAFFQRHGFEPIDRASVPPSIQKSAEFASICPSSAAVLRLKLRD